MTVLRDVELSWCKLGSKLDNGFDGNSPARSVTVSTRDKQKSKEWAELGMNVKTKDDDEGIYWSVSLRKPTHSKDGREMPGVPVVGKDKMPFADVESIGNGTRANVKVNSFDYDYKGKKGVSFRLDAVQILDLIEYKGGTSPVDYFDEEL